MIPDDPTENIVPFPPPSSVEDEERLHRIRAEAERLANQNDVDRTYFLPKRAEEIGVSERVLKSAVSAVLRERAMRTAAEQLEKDRQRKREEQQRAADDRKDAELAKEQKREQKRLAKELAKEAEREKRRAEKQAERAKLKAEREAERKSKEKAKGFGNISRLPVARHEKELQG